MKHRSLFAALAALVMLTTVGCGASREATNSPATKAVMNGDVPDAAPAEAAADDAADDAGVPAVYGEREAMADAKSEEKIAAAGAFAEDAGAADKAFEAVYEGEVPDDAPAPDVIKPEEPVSRPEAGILTAGEWRDHDNWGFFSNLVKSGTIAFPSFGLDPCRRVAVDLTDSTGAPLPNAHVTLLDKDGAPLWDAVSDHNGKAYLFEPSGVHAVSVRAVSGGTESTAEIPAASDGTQGGAAVCTDRAVSLKLDTAAAAAHSTQIMFIVDTTGSMSDEMLYLQSDFGAIAGEVGDADTQYAALFYKDEGDSYVTRYEGFTADVSDIRQQLNRETATGGGDEPEAVAEAFTEAFVSENWADDAVKVAFLIYDAPPHAEKAAELTEAVEAAAAKGIRLVPVVSSNGSRETELFGRACAIMTGGSYVFLTDDSGVGGSHLEPIIGDYKVEKLHDIIVRIIQTYKQ